MFNDLREFLRFLEEKGDLVRIEREVAREYELGYGMRRTCDISGPALLFEKVRGYNIPVLGASYGTRRRCQWALGLSEDKVCNDFINGMKNPISPRIVSQGPCKEVIWTGNKIDLNQLPIPWISPKDGGYFVNFAVLFAKDPEYGRNISIHRSHVLGKNRIALDVVPPQHVGVFYERAEERGEPLEVALAIGVEPAIVFASQIKTSIGVDETSLAGGLKGGAVELVRCETINAEVPASSEIVLEGRMLLNVREKEGPFGEYTGYYGKAKMRPVIEVTAITTRERPIYQACSMPHEDDFVKQIPFEAVLFEHVRRVCPTVRAVHFPREGGCHEDAIISIKQTRKEEAKSVIISAFGCGLGLKNVVVVDDDIDVFNQSQVHWAITYRCQPADDVIILRHIQSVGLDPSVQDMPSGMGIDATRPFGAPFAEPLEVPEAKKFEIPGWPKNSSD